MDNEKATSRYMDSVKLFHIAKAHDEFMLRACRIAEDTLQKAKSEMGAAESDYEMMIRRECRQQIIHIDDIP